LGLGSLSTGSSGVYKWSNSTNTFTVLSSVSFSGAKAGDIEFLTIENKMYMFVASQSTTHPHMVYKWNTRVGQFDALATLSYAGYGGAGWRWNFSFFNGINWASLTTANKVNFFQLY